MTQYGLYDIMLLSGVLDSLSLVESNWYYYVMVDVDSHLKLILTSMSDIYKVFEHIDMLSIGTW